MKIKLSLGSVLAAVGVAAIAYVTYKAIKSDMDREQELEDTKKDILENQASKEVMDEATFKNEHFDTQQKADAYRVLLMKRNAIEKAKTEKDVYSALDKFKNVLDEFNGDEPLAYLIFETDKLKRCEKELESCLKRNHEKDLEREKRYTELEKARVIARSIDKVAALTNNRTSLERLVKDAQDVAITITK